MAESPIGDRQIARAVAWFFCICISNLTGLVRQILVAMLWNQHRTEAFNR
jgi:hypothetical protein